MAWCIICGETHPDHFKDSRDDFCVRCKDILDYWFKESFEDIKTTSVALKGKELTKKEYADALEVYGNVKWREEYVHSKDR